MQQTKAVVHQKTIYQKSKKSNLHNKSLYFSKYIFERCPVFRLCKEFLYLTPKDNTIKILGKRLE